MQNPKVTLLLLVAVAYTTLASAQQVADTLFNPEIVRPAYAKAQGPAVLIDEAHSNFHTVKGRFKPFARVLEKDGYVVGGFSQPFTNEGLTAAKILVIANALHPDNGENWSLPTPSAFTDAEIEALNAWVKKGGALFLIADHMPFPGAAEKLAASFGFRFLNGFAMKKKAGKDLFTPGKGLMTNALTNGRDKTEKIASLQTFTGQAFEIPQNATPVVVLSSDYEIKLPQTAWEFEKNTQVVSAENLVQGAYMKYGAGRVVVFGEAAMFTAQLQRGKNKMGMNAPSASQNAQFLLNTIHWLDGIIK
ncbi:hypothetical protein KK083_03820 [Fulvivirgaceae bacterium PWU4]|uniref:DUF4350 domain-containing protein n=1 Tax=Chryseosolibacter histidini TaxID=2782349 RepID=A0AAP2DGQ0_9BACT|nr:DUF4350 domain-containing protein [Chryseosolibacter histidini]MBT1695990.1 hypothetical protein [Chryseosolibacter histidini]